MSSPHPQDPSPSKSTKQFDTRQSSANPNSPKRQPPLSYSSAETPQVTAGSSSLPSNTSAAETRYPFGPPAPLILVSEPSLSPTSDRRDRDRAASVPRQGRPLEPQGRSTSHSCSQPTTRSSTPRIPRTRSAPEQSLFATMSSAASSPGNTSTSGSASGSNPGYHLPYAPFPYPMPGGARGGQGGQGSGGGSGSGK